MKKFVSILLLACIFLLPLAAIAEDFVVEPVSGVILDIGEDAILLENESLGYVIVNLTETTVITGVEELEEGMFVYVNYNGMMTRSFPGQINADEILVHRLSGNVLSVEENSFMINDELFGEVIVHWENAAQSVAVGSPATVYYDGVMALSLPGQVNAQKVDTFTLTGIVYDMADGGFLLQDADNVLYLVKVSEELQAAVEIVRSAKVTVLFDGIMTRSIPAQVSALAILDATETTEEAVENAVEEAIEE